jgi:hypothetical protein
MKFNTFILFYFIFCSFIFSTTLIVNSLDYKDIISSAVFAKNKNYTFLFALTPNQSVFLTKYYTTNKDEPIIYIEGKDPVLVNMGFLLQEAKLKNLSINKPENIPLWIADQLSYNEVILVGSKYGQDALAVSSYAALVGAPILFFDPSKEDELLSNILVRNYSKVIIYGPINSQMSDKFLSSLKNKEIIDTGSKYLNNLEIVKKFLAIKPSRQGVFVSGYTFEKSMIDTSFPLFLVGKSSVPSYYIDFLEQNQIKTGVVFSGDGDIVDGVNYIRSQLENMQFFVKFGEGYRGSAQPLPLVVIPLPSPKFQIEVQNLSYNIKEKLFELKLSNKGDFVALSAAISLPKSKTAQSSQIFLDSNKTTTLAIPIDASADILNNKIPSASLTILYGEDSKLMDNIDILTIENIPISNYSDNSSVRFLGLEYYSPTKEFVLAFDGQGWVEGTISFNINNRVIVLRVPLSKINGLTKIKIKHFLSAEEENYVNKLETNFFFRSGEEQSILLKEKRGSIPINVQKSSSSNSNLILPSLSKSSDFFIYIFVFIGLFVIIIFILNFFRKRGDSFF